MHANYLPTVCADPNSWWAILIVGGLLGSFALSWYYSNGWPSFIILTPPNQPAQYIGLHTFASNVFFWAEPTIYVAIVQATNNHRLAFASMVVWALLGLLLVITVNFEKGKRECGQAASKAVAPV